MSEKRERILAYLKEAAEDGFRTVDLRTQPMSPGLAADVLRQIPAEERFDSKQVAEHLEKLPLDTGDAVRLDKSSSRTFLTVSVPGDRQEAFAWADQFLTNLSATSLKMNLGPDKTTDLKVFWGRPDINTLIEIGGVD